MPARLGAHFRKGLERRAVLVHVGLAGAAEVAQCERDLGVADERVGGLVELLERRGAVGEGRLDGARLHLLEAERQQIRNEVMAAIGEASAGALPDGSGWTFKTQTTAGYTKTVPPNTYRVLRYSKRVSKTEEA